MSQLSVAGLGVSVAGRRLLRRVSFELATGQCVALVGPSGSGKSTLLRCIAGLIDPDEGRVTLNGDDGNALGWPEWRRRVSYVAQRPVMLDDSVRGNLERPSGYRSVRLGGGVRYEGWLQRLGLSARQLEQSARSLSVGEQQRVALVRALGVGPDVMLLDEPTSALDSDSVSRVERLLLEMLEEGGKGALVVTHDRGQAERLGHEVVDIGQFEAADG